MRPVTPSQEQQDLLTKARTLLIVDHPFFASIILRKPIIWTCDVPTAACSPRGQIYLNPEWVSSKGLTSKNMIFLLAHEAFHYILLHGVRRGHRDPVAWNIAGDKVINDTLIDAKVGEFIDGGVTEDGARHLSTESLYNEDDKDSDGPGGAGSDILSHDPGDGDGDDGSGDRPLTEGEIAEIEAQVKIDLVQAKQTAKMQGKLPAALERLVDSMVQVKTPWEDILERFMVSFRRDDLSWSRPNRRHIGADTYLPGTNYVPEMGEVVVAIDTSGSIDEETLSHFAGHINRILSDCRPTKLHVVYCDTQINRSEELTVDDLPWKPTMVGGGGTDLRSIFHWIDDQGLEPDVLVVLTDMYTPFPSEAPSYSTLWVSTSRVDTAPFGDVIQYEV